MTACIFRGGCAYRPECIDYCQHVERTFNMSNINKVSNELSLVTVVMPLVRILADTRLSWAEREKVSMAICVTHQQWTALEKERQLHQQAQASGQQTQNGGTGTLNRPQYDIG